MENEKDTDEAIEVIMARIKYTLITLFMHSGMMPAVDIRVMHKSVRMSVQGDVKWFLDTEFDYPKVRINIVPQEPQLRDLLMFAVAVEDASEFADALFQQLAKIKGATTG